MARAGTWQEASQRLLEDNLDADVNAFVQEHRDVPARTIRRRHSELKRTIGARMRQRSRRGASIDQAVSQNTPEKQRAKGLANTPEKQRAKGLANTPEQQRAKGAQGGQANTPQQQRAKGQANTP